MTATYKQMNYAFCMAAVSAFYDQECASVIDVSLMMLMGGEL